uniref:Activating signal cointegrator 1 complex subunit 2 n=1 Tax=Ornithorhynchus anatinus TaxID=9258 RepID=A0A6I8ND18_ORNAN
MPALPLDQLQLPDQDPKTGKPRTLPALHPARKAERYFVLYKPPPDSDTPALVEEFLERATFIADDLDWLLALPHHQFWCQVIFDETLQKCLDSYLRSAPRKFDAAAAPTSAVGDLQRRLHRSVFLTFLRMSTHKESRDHFISPSAFGEILYDNFLFDIPKMLDLCVLFGKGNGPLLQKMIENVFVQQASYYSDLEETVPTVLQVLGSILRQCGLRGDAASAEPQKLGERGRTTPSHMPLEELKDIVLYLCDTSTTLWAFLDVFPQACQTFQKHDFCYRLASFYEAAIPELEAAIKKRRLEDSGLFADLWQRLSHSRKKLVGVFHILINQLCLLPILESSCDNIQLFIEEFLQIFTSLLQEKRFLRDYDELFPVADDVSLLEQASAALDETRTAYILQAVEGAWEGVERRPARAPPRDLAEPAAAAEPSTAGAAGAAAPAVHLSRVELDSLISQVKDLLPDLGEGFVLACLEHYGYDAEQVINNILEERLAPSLSRLDRTLNRQLEPDPTPLVTSRYNVFQNDEFDVFSRDSVDLSRVQKGRRRLEPTRSLLNDKRAVQEQRGRYEQYSVVVDEVPVQDGQGQAFRDDYDDEYDDTYDGNQVGANDVDSDDELISRRPFTIPRILRTKVPNERPEDDDDEEEEEAEDDAPKVPDGLIPPSSRSRYKHDSSAVAAGAGNPKTGQERRKKEANKGARANHNRRNMADRKRSKGMIPS